MTAARAVRGALPRVMRSDASRLVVVDVQEKLLPAIHDGDRVLESVSWLVQVARRMGVPVAATEQYPKGLGPTVEPLRGIIGEGSIAAKVAFSCAEGACLERLPGADRPQVILAGVEAHVCVLQSALGLAARGHDVFVVADAVGSRDPENRRLALDRMRDAGVSVVSREMVAFEWLREAGTDVFRDVSRTFLRQPALPAP